MPRLVNVSVLLLLLLTTQLAEAATWQNPLNPLDVNANGQVNIQDLLSVVNSFLRFGTGPINSLGLQAPPPYADVNGDDYLSAIDSLLLINDNYSKHGGTVVSTSADTVGVKLVATDIDGNPITEARVGDEFELRMYVQDNRSTPLGVNSTFADIHFDGSRVWTLAQLYQNNWKSFDDKFGTPGLITRAGGVSFEVQPPEQVGWILIDDFKMQATAPGTVMFSASTKETPLYDTLLFGVNSPLPLDQVEYQGTYLTIVPEPSTYLLAALALLGLLVSRFPNTASRNQGPAVSE